MITEEQARGLAEMAAGIDGGCPICAQAACETFNRLFPEWEWATRRERHDGDVVSISGKEGTFAIVGGVGAEVAVRRKSG